jgi:hypothetical protein
MSHDVERERWWRAADGRSIQIKDMKDGTLGQNGPNQAIAKKVPTKLTINPVPAIVVGKLPYEFCVDIDTK